MQIVRKEFQNSTVLIIAHKVECLQDACDRVLKLSDNGELVMFDTPSVVLGK